MAEYIAETNVTEELKASVPTEFWQFQKEGVRFLLTHKRTILADEMGLGKSAQTLITVKNVKKLWPKHTQQMLIVCPNRAVYQWKGQAKKWYGDLVEHMYLYVGKPNERYPELEKFKEDPQGVLITNYALFRQLVQTTLIVKKGEFKEMIDKDREKLAKALVSPEGYFPLYYDIGVFDEAHELKNRKSVNAELVRQMVFDRIHLVTGSPMSRGPQDLWGMLNFLYPREFKSYWNFVYAFCEVSDNGYGKAIGEAKNQEQMRKFLSGIMIRREKKEVASHMPPKTRDTLEVQMTERQKQQYYQMLESSILALNGGGLPIDWEDGEDEVKDHKFMMASPIVISQMSRLQSLLICPKMLAKDELQEELFDFGGAIEGVVEHAKENGHTHFAIFTPFSRALKYFEQYLKLQDYTDIFTFKGGMKAEKLHEQAEAVKAVRGVALVSIKTGTSWDLETCPIGYFISMDYDPQMNFQAEDRLDRMNRTGTVNIYYTHHEYTLDDAMIDCVLNKQVNVLSVYKTPQDLAALLKGN